MSWQNTKKICVACHWLQLNYIELYDFSYSFAFVFKIIRDIFKKCVALHKYKSLMGIGKFYNENIAIKEMVNRWYISVWEAKRPYVHSIQVYEDFSSDPDVEFPIEFRYIIFKYYKIIHI